jgi:hypothetical protein
LGVSRDRRIDTLRGLALAGMTVAHVQFRGIKSAFPTFGYVGPAEPFVLLAGLVAGMIYWRMAEEQPARAVWRRGLRRAGFLYLVYLGLAFGIIALTRLFRSLGAGFLPYQSTLIAEDPALAAALVPVLLFQPGYADILPMYFVFIALTPAVVLAARAGHLRACLAVSAALWVLAQLGVGDRLMGPVVAHFGSSLPYFDILGWQVVFVGGLVLGMRRAMGKDPVVPLHPALLAASAAVVVVCFATSWGAFGAPSRRGGLGWLEDRSAFGPLRVLNTAAWVVVCAWLGRLRTSWLEQPYLAFIGAHALPVFVYSCFLGYALWLVDGTPLAVRVTAVILGLASLTLPALAQERWRAARAAARAPRARADAALPQNLRDA